MEGMSNQALGLDPGRFAYGLPPGTGKTQGLIAWAATVFHLGLDVSLSISAAQITALCALKSGLIEAGVPESAIGLKHSYGNGERWPDTGDDDRPIMLVSHSRIRLGRDATLFGHHRERPRSLLIWDETLTTASIESLSWQDLKAASIWIASDAPENSALGLTIRSAIGTVSDELEAQKYRTASASVSIDTAHLDAAQDEAKALGDWGSDLRIAAVKTVRTLLKMLEHPVAVVRTGNGASGEGVIRYAMAVGSELTNIAVLDASHPIRDLARNGGVVDRTSDAMRDCKSYEKVSVNEISLPAGKTKLESEAGLNSAASSLADVIRLIPETEHVLIVTFKGDRGRMPSRLLTRLHGYEGIDVSARIDGKARFSVLTWGRETSLNSLRHCKYVILLGVLRRNPLDLAACAAAAADDLGLRLSKQALKKLEISEMSHCVYQAMSRGSCRIMSEAGKADPMNLTIIGRVQGVREMLGEVMPGVSWTHTVPDRQPRPGCRTAEAAHAIRTYLRSVPREQSTVSIRKMKAVIEPRLARESWRVALSDGRMLASLPIRGEPAHWEIAGQSLRRVS